MHRYTRSLEERIAELEAQLTRTPQTEVSPSRRRITVHSATADESNLSNDKDRNSENIDSGPEQYSTPRQDTRSGLSHVTEVEEQSPPLVVPTCASRTHASFSSPSYSLGLLGSSISGDTYGHNSLLTSILATLAKSTSCGGYAPGGRPLGQIELYPNIANHPLSLDHSTRVPIEFQDTLVQIYLERVNPRYPFLHVGTFLGWYKTWKARPKDQPTADPKDRWTDFFVTMVHSIAVAFWQKSAQIVLRSKQSASF